MGKLINFTSLRCMREYEAIHLHPDPDQDERRKRLKEWRNRYKRLLRGKPKRQNIWFWQKQNKL